MRGFQRADAAALGGCRRALRRLGSCSPWRRPMTEAVSAWRPLFHPNHGRGCGNPHRDVFSGYSWYPPASFPTSMQKNHLLALRARTGTAADRLKRIEREQPLGQRRCSRERAV